MLRGILSEKSLLAFYLNLTFVKLFTIDKCAEMSGRASPLNLNPALITDMEYITTI